MFYTKLKNKLRNSFTNAVRSVIADNNTSEHFTNTIKSIIAESNTTESFTNTVKSIVADSNTTENFTNTVRSIIADSNTTENKSINYLSSIAINNSNLVFDSIGAVNKHLQGEVHSDIFSEFPEIDIDSMISRDSYNLPATCDREFYHGDRHYDWWLSGLLDYLKIKRVLEKYGQPLKAGDSFYEMGCATGRVLRHFAAQQDNLNVWGSDINNRHVEWMRLNLQDNIKIFHNTILPQIPLESNSIDIACAFSVFTHIDDLDLAWLCEIRRILKKGGIFYVTIHSDDTWKFLRPNDQIYQTLMQDAPYIRDYKVTEEFLASELPQDKTAFICHGNNYNANVFHKKHYIHREWGRFFNIREIIRGGHQYQDVVVMQKPQD
jgi:SAM-dependent methyltransferase